MGLFNNFLKSNFPKRKRTEVKLTDRLILYPTNTKNLGDKIPVEYNTIEDIVNLASTSVTVANGLTTQNGEIVLGGTLNQDTVIDTSGNSLSVQSEGSAPNISVSVNFAPTSDSIFAIVETNNTGVSEAMFIQLDTDKVGFVYKEDLDMSPENSIKVFPTGVEVRGQDDLAATSNLRVRNASDDTLLEVFNDGKITMPEIVPLDFADDTAAATGNVAIGGIYHTSGTLKIRIT